MHSPVFIKCLFTIVSLYRFQNVKVLYFLGAFSEYCENSNVRWDLYWKGGWHIICIVLAAEPSVPASLPAEASQVRGGGGNQLLLLVTVTPIRHHSPTCPDIVSPGDNLENTRTSCRARLWTRTRRWNCQYCERQCRHASDDWQHYNSCLDVVLQL